MNQGALPSDDEDFYKLSLCCHGEQCERKREDRDGSCATHDYVAKLENALRNLIRVNEEWNASVEKIIGRPPNWTDGYLEAARAALAPEDRG